MKTKSFIVLNPHNSTYQLFNADSVESLAKTLGAEDVEENGTYISHNTPAYQVIEVAKTDVFDLR